VFSILNGQKGNSIKDTFIRLFLNCMLRNIFFVIFLEFWNIAFLERQMNYCLNSLFKGTAPKCPMHLNLHFKTLSTSLSLSLSKFVYVYACVCMCVYVYMCVYVCVCVYLCMCVSNCVFVSYLKTSYCLWRLLTLEWQISWRRLGINFINILCTRFFMKVLFLPKCN